MRATIYKVHKKALSLVKLYGTTTLGTRGQLVIPANARQELNLKPGDQILVMGRYKRMIGLIKAEQIDDILKMLLKKLAGTGLDQMIKAETVKKFSRYLTKK